MAAVYTNFAISTVQFGSTIAGSASAGTTIVLGAGDGAAFPGGDGTTQFTVVLSKSGIPKAPDVDVATVTRVGDTLTTVARGVEGVPANATIQAGWYVYMAVTKGLLDSLVPRSFPVVNDYSLQLGQVIHARIPKGTVTWQLGDYGHTQFAYNPNLPPIPFGNMIFGTGLLAAPDHGRFGAVAGMWIHCPDDPGDIDGARLGPPGAFPGGYGARGPVGNHQSYGGVDLGSALMQYKGGGSCVPWTRGKGGLFTRGAGVLASSGYLQVDALERLRAMSPVDNALGGMLTSYVQSPGGGNSLDYWMRLKGDGTLLVGRSAIDGGAPGVHMHVRADAGRNEIHRLGIGADNAFATAVLQSDGVNVADGDTVTINDKTYRFKTTPVQLYDVTIGVSADASLQNLCNAVVHADLSGNSYYFNTSNPQATDYGYPPTASDVVAVSTNVFPYLDVDVVNHRVTFVSRSRGTLPNAYPSTETSAHLSFGAATFQGGTVPTAGTFTLTYNGTPAATPLVGGVGAAVPGSGSVTVDVTNGSATVTGHNTLWSTGTALQKIFAGEWLRISVGATYLDGSNIPDVAVQVQSVTDDTHLVLGIPGGAAEPWLGANASGKTFVRISEISTAIAYNATLATIQTDLELLPSILGAVFTKTGLTMNRNGGAGGVGLITGGTGFINGPNPVFRGDPVRFDGDSPGSEYFIAAVDSDSQIRLTTVYGPANGTPGTRVMTVLPVCACDNNNLLPATTNPLPTGTVYLMYGGNLRHTRVLLETVTSATTPGSMASSQNVQGLPDGRANVQLQVQPAVGATANPFEVLASDGVTKNFAVSPTGALTLSDVTGGNVTSTAHGLAPKSPADATKFLNGAATPAFALPPGTEIGYAQRTTDVTVTATSSATATDLSLSTGAITYDGTPVIVEFFCQRFNKGTGSITVVLYDGSTELGRLCLTETGALSMLSRYRFTPSAGSHTYLLKAFVDAGTGTVQAGDGTINNRVPAFIRITKA